MFCNMYYTKNVRAYCVYATFLVILHRFFEKIRVTSYHTKTINVGESPQVLTKNNTK